MHINNLLTDVLNAFHQKNLKPEEIDQTLSNTISLLTVLTNPLNISLLTSHLLTAPSIWGQAEGLVTSFRILSIFNTAAIHVQKNEPRFQSNLFSASQLRQGSGIESDNWARAVIKGLDEKSARWQHGLVIAGVLLGMEGQERHGLSTGLRYVIEDAMVTAMNLALNQTASYGIVPASSIVLAINYVFPILKENAQTNLDYDTLLPIMMRAITSVEGYQNGSFLLGVNADLRSEEGNKIDWPANSNSFLHLQKLNKKPLFAIMGSLSQLIAHAVENVKSPFKVIEARELLLAFTSEIFDKWKKTKFSEIDIFDEGLKLNSVTIQETLPLLWQVLKMVFFTSILILRAILGRTLIDIILSSRQHALFTASKSLLMLKNMHFMTTRFGSTQFSAYAFVNFASIDILTLHAHSVKDFLCSIYPVISDRIPVETLERNNHLFFLNVAEHLSVELNTEDIESLIVPICKLYLLPKDNLRLSQLFEAAHSVMLSIFIAPKNEKLGAKILPSYIETLLVSFPSNLSPEQFRVAFKALIQICTPPNPLGTSQPLMAEALIEVLHHRALNSPTTPISSRELESHTNDQKLKVLLSEQSVLLLAILDALPYICPGILEFWLQRAADLLNMVPDKEMRDYCKRQFWEILENGQMDVDRSLICISWWGSKGGRNKVLFNKSVEAGPFMSGGLSSKNLSSKL
ncbi:Peroxisomal membrane protein PEX17 [Erysiphe neolycopersici]|uniref:Peroxisomal membrane protein PEX17 n=1 Tax=Erysiphe neolycopersici TaxID=212602 RepID=A0A420HCG9_9PEZI|nr:Peroxisomal membrane protein PEX17 [Erysiphe neolycopersici]